MCIKFSFLFDSFNSSSTGTFKLHYRDCNHLVPTSSDRGQAQGARMCSRHLRSLLRHLMCCNLPRYFQNLVNCLEKLISGHYLGRLSLQIATWSNPTSDQFYTIQQSIQILLQVRPMYIETETWTVSKNLNRLYQNENTWLSLGDINMVSLTRVIKWRPWNYEERPRIEGSEWYDRCLSLCQ